MTTIKKAADKFYIGEDIKAPLAEMTYVTTGESIIVIDHTYVSDELRGQGIAGKLLDEVVQYARDSGKKIKPVCVYAKKKLEESTDYEDVLFTE